MSNTDFLKNTNNLDLIYKFINLYFEENEIQYKYPDKGVLALNQRLSSFLETKDKIDFLKNKYTEIYPKEENDLSHFSTYLGEGSAIKTWDRFFGILLINNPDFVVLFFERIKPFSNGKKNPFISENFYRFYNFYSDLRESSIYEHLSDVTDLLTTWGRYSGIKYRLDWMKSKLNEFENLKSSEETNKNSLSSNVKTLKELFQKDDKFDDVIDLLIQKEVISDSDEGYIVIIPDKYKKRGRQLFICAIGNNLHNKNYLKICNDIDIVHALNNLFCNSNITKQNYYSLLESPNHDKFLGFTNFL
ncbi:MAG: hypothetical protein V7719_14935 [Psychroserpens sp.]|uniref:hypothetical protein n=1 Tax=Psychroserpens sp. TaxID=2020870 RepID=UPI0030026329